MNEEQRAVLAAIGRMEQGHGSLIDEYTVAREAGVVRGELPSQEYVHSQERARIRQLLDELEQGGMIRVSREGYWRPRTTLAGRRAWQDPQASLLPAGVVMPPQPPQQSRAGSAPIPGIFGDDDDEPPRPRWAGGGEARAPERGNTGEEPPRAWPTWWPAALRFGDPGLTPLIGAAAAGVVVLLLVILVATRVAGGRGPAPTPTISAVGRTATAIAALPPPTQPPAGTAAPPSGATGATPSASAKPSASAAPTEPPPPTPTAGPQSAQVRIANTELQGAWLYATPAGERTTLAVPEGTLVDVAGPDERDTQGRNWKQIRWANDVYWILEEYTTPADQ